jgi:uncharacterized membrane protein
VLSSVTIGILAGPMIAGLVIVTLRLLRKEHPEPDAGKVFKGFDYFLNSFLLMVIWGIPLYVGSIILAFFPFIGQLLSPVFACVAQAFLMFGIFLIVDRQMNFWPASMEIIHTVKTNLWPFLGLMAVSSIIGNLGAIALGIGIVLTIPIQICILAVAYRDIFNAAKRPSTSDFTQSADPV